MLEKMLMLDPNRRITADEALSHEYFKADPQPATHEEISAILNIK